MTRFLCNSITFLAALSFASAVVVSDSLIDLSTMRAEPSVSPEAVPDPMGISMYVVPVGSSQGPVQMISGSASICRAEYADGFTIECRDSDATAMQFVIGGDTVKSEAVEPYFIAGDVNGTPSAWTGYPKIGKPFVLACKPGNGERLQVAITITC